MVKALSFKGDKKSKKRKREAPLVEDDESRPSSKALTIAKTSANTTQQKSQDDDATVEDDSWVTADAVGDVAGPIIFVLPTLPATCLATDVNGKVFASQLENIVDEDARTAEPHDVRQVWIANRVAGTESFSFKGHHGRYLGCDRVGVLSSTKEAISPEESFNVVAVADNPGAFAVQTLRDKFLGVQEGTEDGEVARMQLRGDAEGIVFSTTLRVRMQARFKPRLKANKEEKAREKISRKELEEAVGRSLTDEEVKRLKRARKQGDYHEVLLDVRVKGKHDKFA